MKIGKALKLCRTQKGMTRARLAVLADLSPSYISLLEQGKRDPNMATIEKLCSALSIPVSILVFLASDPSELQGMSKELAEKLALTALQLMDEDDSNQTKLSA